MPQMFYCNVCRVQLPSCDPAIQKTHFEGKKHKENVKRNYDEEVRLLNAFRNGFHTGLQAHLAALNPGPNIDNIENVPALPMTEGEIIPAVRFVPVAPQIDANQGYGYNASHTIVVTQHYQPIPNTYDPHYTPFM